MANDYRFEEVMNDSQEGEITTMCEVLDKIVAKSEEKKEAQVNERVAKTMLQEKAKLSFIKLVSHLSEETIRAIAQKINVEVVEG